MPTVCCQDTIRNANGKQASMYVVPTYDGKTCIAEMPTDLMSSSSLWP